MVRTRRTFPLVPRPLVVLLVCWGGTLKKGGAAHAVPWPPGLEELNEPVLLATSLLDCPGSSEPARQAVASPGAAPGDRVSSPPWEIHAREGNSRHSEGAQLSVFRAGGCVQVAGQVAVSPLKGPAGEVEVSLEGRLGDYRATGCAAAPTPGQEGESWGGAGEGAPPFVSHIWSGRGCAGGCLVGGTGRLPLPLVPGVFSLCVRWNLRGGAPGPGGKATAAQVAAAPTAEVWTHHLIATTWRGSLPGWIPYGQVAVWGAQAVGEAWPLPGGAAEAEEAVGRALLSGMMRLGKRGEIVYGVWERPRGMRDSEKTWHLLRSRRGLCGELTALLEEMLASQGVASAGVKLCFADALAGTPPTPEGAPHKRPLATLYPPPRDAIWFLATRRAGERGPPPGRRAVLGQEARMTVDFRDHSALAVGSGWVLDATYGVASPSVEDYIVHMARVQWEFCACRGGNWSDEGCRAGPGPAPPPGTRPTAGGGRAPPGSRGVDTPCAPLPSPPDGVAAAGGGKGGSWLGEALPSGQVPLQVVRYDPRGRVPPRVVAGYASDVLCA